MDLADLFPKEGDEPTPMALPPKDLSGRPCPTRAFATLSSGIVVDCPVVFGGIRGNDRRYKVIAELDWATAQVVSIEVDRWPPDVMVTLKVPDDWDDERCKTFGHGIVWTVAGQGYQPMRMERTPD